MTTMLLATAIAVLAPSAAAEAPIELGRVTWLRDLPLAQAQSRASGKPIFALFQEIPGCVTCRNFGSDVLSDYLLVRAIEELFVPLAVYNNRGGADAALLERFGEPSWNNPVVRFLDANAADVIPRAAGVFSNGAVRERMLAALKQAQRPVPAWLVGTPARVERAVFAMHCFWEGEARLGALDGVLATQVGWQSGSEVVSVEYDPTRSSYEQLVKRAAALGCATRVFPQDAAQRALALGLVGAQRVGTRAAPTAAAAGDDKYYLQRSEYRNLPLTRLQRTKVNAALRAGEDPTRWLSAHQERLLERLRSRATRAALRTSRGGDLWAQEAALLALFNE